MPEYRLPEYWLHRVSADVPAAGPFSVAIPQIEADGPGARALVHHNSLGRAYGNKPGNGACSGTEFVFRRGSSSVLAVAGSYHRRHRMCAPGLGRLLPISTFPSWFAVGCSRPQHLDSDRFNAHSSAT